VKILSIFISKGNFFNFILKNDLKFLKLTLDYSFSSLQPFFFILFALVAQFMLNEQVLWFVQL
jgi:hypothetical protein